MTSAEHIDEAERLLGEVKDGYELLYRHQRPVSAADTAVFENLVHAAEVHVSLARITGG